MILSVGELLWDVHVEPDGTLETGEQLRRVPGGATSNVCLELARLGLAVAVAGTLSDDALGFGLSAALAARGVDTTRLVHLPGRTGVVFLERNEPEHERFVSYRPTLGGFRGCELPAPLYAVHLAALTPNPDDLEVLVQLASDARAAGAWVLVDANARPLPWREKVEPRAVKELAQLLELIDVLKVSASDRALLDAVLGDVVERVAAGGGTTFETRGGEPTSATGPWGTLARRPLPVTLVRSIGAGDAFVAGALARLVTRPRDAAARVDANFWDTVLDAALGSAARRVSSRW